MLFQLAYSLNGHPVRLLGPLLVGPALSYLWPQRFVLRLLVQLLKCKAASANTSRLAFVVNMKTTGYARGSKKAMPMSRNDKPPTIQ